MLNAKDLFLTLNLALALAASGALAGDPPGGGPGTTGRVISFEELKARCANPEQTDIQRAPQNIRVQCTDSRLNWLAEAPGEVPLSTGRYVTSAVYSDKFWVDGIRSTVDVPNLAGTCHRYKQVEEKVTVERPLSCDELLGLKQTLSEFCAAAIDSAKGSNPKLTEVSDTGQRIDTCGLGPAHEPVPAPTPKH